MYVYLWKQEKYSLKVDAVGLILGILNSTIHQRAEGVYIGTYT
jgi:hypothetical protein